MAAGSWAGMPARSTARVIRGLEMTSRRYFLDVLSLSLSGTKCGGWTKNESFVIREDTTYREYHALSSLDFLSSNLLLNRKFRSAIELPRVIHEGCRRNPVKGVEFGRSPRPGSSSVSHARECGSTRRTQVRGRCFCDGLFGIGTISHGFTIS